MSASFSYPARIIPCGAERGTRTDLVGGALPHNILSRNIPGLGACKTGLKITWFLYLLWKMIQLTIAVSAG